MANTLTPEEGAELNRLLAEHAEAGVRAGAVLAKHGMESPEFREADAATGALWVRIRELQGMAGKSWMA
jgi:hypothetical protein